MKIFYKKEDLWGVIEEKRANFLFQISQLISLPGMVYNSQDLSVLSCKVQSFLVVVHAPQVGISNRVSYLITS